MRIEVGDHVTFNNIPNEIGFPKISEELLWKLGTEQTVSEVGKDNIRIEGSDEWIPKSWVKSITWKHLNNEETKRYNVIEAAILEKIHKSKGIRFWEKCEKSLLWVSFAVLMCILATAVISFLTVDLDFKIIYIVTKVLAALGPVGLVYILSVIILYDYAVHHFKYKIYREVIKEKNVTPEENKRMLLGFPESMFHPGNNEET